MLDRFVAGVRAGEGRALVVRGEPGVGKTALLDYLAGQASGCRVARAAGVQSEMELAFAGLHQLCAPMLDHAESLPVPQREALRAAFGLSAGPVPDRFLVGLAVLGLLSETAGERPLVCVVDDQQWLDHASAQALGFAARRLAADPVGLVFAARVPGQDVAGLPELVVEGLAERDARALLESVLSCRATRRAGPDRIIADAHGNPLALLELPRGRTSAQLTGGFGLGSAIPLDGRIEESFARQLETLPAQTRRLVQLAAADPSGDPVLVWRAAGRLAIGAGAAVPAEEARLAEFGARVRFRHPLVRSAAYRSASVQTRQELHSALAEATDPAVDPDRRAWHRAQAAPGPDEDVAAELEQCAGRAQRRGGLAAAAAFLERSAGLTVDPVHRAQRALAAAQAKLQAGAPDAALGLLAMAQAGPLDELQRARGDLLRAQVAFASSHGRDAPPLILSAAKQLESLDIGLARETYLEAFTAALFVGRLSPAVGDVAKAARMAPAPLTKGRAPDLLLDGLALLVTEGYAAGAPALRRALRAVRSQDISAQEGLGWLWLAGMAAIAVWDDETWHILASRHIKLARDAGALSELPLAALSRYLLHAHAGELEQGAALIAEAQAVADATGSQLGPYGGLGAAAFRGREAETAELSQATMAGVTSRGEGRGVATQYAVALLYNGLGRYDKALAAAELACEYDDIGVVGWSLTELVEAAVRSGQPARASGALQRLSETTRASGTDWALGIEARSRALLSEGEAAEDCYREAIERLGRTRMRPAAARAHLLYGEWLRRENRRRDARAELRTAYDLFTAMGIEAFAERARRELLATGETVRKRTAETASELTAQEAHIARLAVGGRTNAAIGAQLFLSTRTVEWHLGKVYTKLGVGSRRELRRALASLGQADPQA